ncbi:Npun_F0296 family exosortase-dependent surface protein [Glacieibacterium megasporae]|uniref:Npun_F0296 family exosortase-dependent surface protein n=1 Tax=Glacieibacterium megasporae TaxID=2835787 RepID=UPI001C1DD540|nr:PEPxxWA-CTERM sorting domain-containing protein [Polymorphobacter megasporae]UAJ09717.1 PEPxxWA-CTERM sorting domain-containing protein [Polymorphobacter megasporae]
MKSLLLFASAVALAGSAQALTITSSPLDVAPAAGETVVFDFNGGAPATGYSYTGGTIFPTSVANVAAAPAGDETPFLAIQGGESATFTFAHAIKSFSIYIGSVDSYNSLQFTGPGYDSGKFSASVLPGGDNGNQTAGDTNRRYFFSFGPGQSVKTVTLSSSQNSFELDNIAVANVPEPSTWVMLVGGFGLVGFARRRKSATKTVAA